MAWTILPTGEAKLNVRSFIHEMAFTLRRGADPMRRAQILAVLRRWEDDEMLDEASRGEARGLRRAWDDESTAHALHGAGFVSVYTDAAVGKTIRDAAEPDLCSPRAFCARAVGRLKAEPGGAA